MLSDGEKEAIEFIKSELQDEKVRVDYQRLTGLYGNLEIEILLNLIEKQSKEIEELKEENDANLAYYDQIYQNGIYTGQRAVENKIKAKIEELENEKEKYFEKQVIQHEIEVLQSLLEKE